MKGRITASIASSVTRLAATTESGSSWRGKRTCFTSDALPTSGLVAVWNAAWKKIQASRPVSTKSGKFGSTRCRAP